MLHIKDSHQSEDAEYALVSIDYIPEMTYYDLDADMSNPFSCSILSTVEAIKCDGEYFTVPLGSDDLAKVAVPENLIDESEVLGTTGLLKKYFMGVNTEIQEVG
jgi:hypothetical protein